MKMSEKITNLSSALVKVQATLRGAEKNAKNPHFKADFANLESVWDSIRSELTKNGLSVSQLMGVSLLGEPTLTTMLMHSTGEWISGEQLLKPVKQDPQAMGSAITYARRYGLAAIVGQIQTDDDGESNMRNEADRANGNAKPEEQHYSRKLITEPQARRLFSISQSVKMPLDELRRIVKEFGFESSEKIEWAKYDLICKRVQDWKPPVEDTINF